MKAVKIITSTFLEGVVVQDYQGYNVDPTSNLIEFVGKSNFLTPLSEFKGAISGDVIIPVENKEPIDVA